MDTRDSLRGIDLLDGNLRGAVGALTVTTGVEGMDLMLELGKAFTAHPHRCALSRRKVGWSWAQKLVRQNPATNSLSVSVVEWDDDSQEEVCSKEYEVAGCSMTPHDFAVTGSYYV